MNKKIKYLADKPKFNMVENIPLREQYLLFSGLMRIFEDFPKNLIEYCRVNNLWWTDLTINMKYRPFWYKEVVNVFNKEKREISLEEVKSVIEPETCVKMS